MTSECYLVLGPDRTGTSLCAGLIKSMGVWLGNNLKQNLNEGQVSNRYYNEDLALIELALRGKGSAKEIVDRLKRPKWGLKLPHLLKVWPSFEPLIENPKFIVCYRNPEDHYHSYNKWINRSSKKYVEEVVDGYYLRSSEIIRDRQTFNVDFDLWFGKLRDSQLRCLSEFVGLPITGEVVKQIKPELRRSKVGAKL